MPATLRAAPLLALLSAGCYRELPLQGAAPAAGTLVHVELTRDGSAQLTELIGAGVASVEGEVVAVSPDAWELALSGTRLQNGNEVRWRGEPIALPAAYVAGVGERRLDRVRTGFAVAVVGAGALLVTKLFQGGAATTDDGDSGNTPPG